MKKIFGVLSDQMNHTRFKEKYVLEVFSKKWYFVTKIFLPTMRKNCSSDREKLLKFEAEGREFAKGQTNFC